MNKYEVKTINLSEIKTPEEHEKAFADAKSHYCNGLEKVWEYCSGKLHRYVNGYCGIKGNVEYIATKL